jgi:hypothetical protein
MTKIFLVDLVSFVHLVYPVNEIDQTDEIDQTNQIDQPNEIDQTNEIDQIDQIDEIDQTNEIDHFGSELVFPIFQGSPSSSSVEIVVHWAPGNSTGFLLKNVSLSRII